MEPEADKPYSPPQAASIYLPPHPHPHLFMLSHTEIGEGLLPSLCFFFFFPPAAGRFAAAVCSNGLGSERREGWRCAALASSHRRYRWLLMMRPAPSAAALFAKLQRFFLGRVERRQILFLSVQGPSVTAQAGVLGHRTLGHEWEACSCSCSLLGRDQGCRSCDGRSQS